MNENLLTLAHKHAARATGRLSLLLTIRRLKAREVLEAYRELKQAANDLEPMVPKEHRLSDTPPRF